MGSQSDELSGPDLAGEGVEESSLVDGVPLVGHAHGEAVMLVKNRREIWAAGAKCTHYGAPLHEGLVVGDTVRCPWHHACFSLRTGDPIRPPALNPIDVWEIARSDGLVRVTRKADVNRRSSVTAIGKPPRSVVILGAGAAGAVAAEVLRRDGYTGPVTIVGREDSIPYDRPNLSKDYLAGNAPEEWIPLRTTEFYEEQGITLALGAGAEVHTIDPGRSNVTLTDGRTIDYGALIYALGSDPIRLPLPGADQSHVFYLRSLDDCRKIIAALPAAKHAVVVGASFIGMESAAALRARGLAVTVVGPEQVPFERTFGEEVGKVVQQAHESKGIAFRLGRKPASIGTGEVVLDDGSKVDADIVVIGVGVKPNIELARRTGCKIEEGAITVDAYLQTSVPGIFAAGDVARWADPRTGRKLRVEHWVVAERMGLVAARNVLGRRHKLSAVPFFWTVQHDLTLSWVGYPEKWESVTIDGSLEGRDAKVTYLAKGAKIAVLTIGRDRACLEAELAFETGQ